MPGSSARSVKLKKSVSAAILLAMFAAGMIISMILLDPPDIYISEICSSNGSVTGAAAEVTDAEGRPCDWIELYNPTEKEVSLSGFSLRKNGGEQFFLGDFTVAPEDYIIVYCSKYGFSDNSVPHADFSIPKAEECSLELIYGYSVCSKTEVPKLNKGNSLSLNADGSAYTSVPTPLAENSSDIIGETPVFSRESGFYADGFSLEITAGEGQTIYYTLDGTDPTSSDSRIEYTGSIEIYDRKGESNRLCAYDPMKVQLDYREGKVFLPEDGDVDKGTVIRACALGRDGYGKVSTAAYFVGLSTEDHSGMPVVSVVTDPDNFYDEETGIYCLGNVYEAFREQYPNHYYNGAVPANYNQTGREWERECYVEFFESDGSLKMSQDAGMRIQGGWSRADYQKSFRFYARGSYGKDSFDCAFWEGLTDPQGNPADSFDTFVLRNGGNDCNYSKFKDIMIQDMVKDRDFSTQTGRACILFIDGEYWGPYILQEDYSPEYFARHYGVAESDVVMYKNDELDEGLPSDLADFNKMREFIALNDMSLEKNYRKASAMLDMESFADYIAAECYIYNDDWPQNNYGCWKTRTVQTSNVYADGRWRFFMFDTESSAYHYNMKTDEVDTFAYLESKKETILGSMVWSLLKNDDFRQMFITDIADMGNICFDHAVYKQYLEKYRSVYYGEMESYFKRFPTFHSIEKSTDPMLDRMTSFFARRQDKVLSLLERTYILSERRNIRIECDSVDGGSVAVNGSNAGNGFSGTYYDGCKLIVTAQPADGYAFVRWEGSCVTEENSEYPELKVNVDGNISVKAVFRKRLL